MIFDTPVHHYTGWITWILESRLLFVQAVDLRKLLCEGIQNIYIEHQAFAASIGIGKPFEIVSVAVVSRCDYKTPTGNLSTSCLRLMQKRCEQFAPFVDQPIS
jgi:hypothetical protein